MVALIPTLVVGLMVLVLLAPENVQDFLQWNVPKQVREDPHSIGWRLVPTIGVFVFGFPLFYGWDRILNSPTRHILGPFEARMAIAGCVFLLAVGLCGCLWPVFLMERVNPALRGKVAALEPRDAKKVMLVGKVFGVVFLLASVNILRRRIQLR